MVFSSLFFLFLFMPITIIIYFITPLKWRNGLLLLVSLIFYGWGEPIYISIMIFSILVDYTHGLLIEKYRHNDKVARRFVVSSVVINLALLGFFKYFDFFAVNLSALPGIHIEPLGLSLPIGISFYTFQTMSYTIDVYRKDAPIQKNIINFGTFVSLFPQLIAGPIVKYKDIAHDLNHRKESFDLFADGINRFVVGLGKKVMLANNAGLLFDVMRGAAGSELSVFGAWLGIFGYAFQIYFDFSGYSDMAIGLGKMFGFRFLDNFNYPYIANSITEFWRRWHISLGTWFREYVYIPLGGSRVSAVKKIRNIFIVWFLTGFWHGASWNFILWGLYFGLILVLEKQFLLDFLKRIPKFFSHFYALFLVMISWVIFYFEDLTVMGAYLKNMFGFGGIPLFSEFSIYYFIINIPLLLILIAASTPIPAKIYKNLCKGSEKMANITSFLMIFVLILFCVAYLVDAAYNPFLYFRF